MKQNDYLKIALCCASLIGIGAISSLVQERKEIKDVLRKQNQAIDILRQQVEDLDFAARQTDKGVIYLVKKR